jgi:competence protein ComFC
MSIAALFTNLLDIVFPRKFRPIQISSLLLLYSPEISTYIVSLFPYRQSMVKKSLFQLKYYGNLSSAKVFGDIIFSFLVEEMSDEILFNNFSRPLIIPLPASPSRLKTRGFNQCELLTNVLKNFNSNMFDVKENILCKPHDTKEQKKLSKRDREKNLRGSFTVLDTLFVRGRDIILVDDVMTTGATLLEARQTLLLAGARTVQAITIAH